MCEQHYKIVQGHALGCECMFLFFTTYEKWKWSCSVVSDSVTPWTVAYQAPVSMGFSRQEYWSGLPFPSSGDLPDSGIKPLLLHCGQTLYPMYNCVIEQYLTHWASQVVLAVKNLPTNAGDLRDLGSIPGLGRSPGRGHGDPLQYSCLENPMDREDWTGIVHSVTKSWTWLKRLSMHACTWHIGGN